MKIKIILLTDTGEEVGISYEKPIQSKKIGTLVIDDIVENYWRTD